MRLAALTLLLCACSTAFPKATASPRSWYSADYPLPLRHDTVCTDELSRAVEYWEVSLTDYARRPVDLFLFVQAKPYHGQPPQGEVWVIDGHTSDGVLGVTESWSYFGRRDRQWSALITLGQHRCDWVVIAHELGHALGLQHAADGCLMFYRRARGYERIHEDELRHVLSSYDGVPYVE